MKAMILAAGLGTRLRPLTDTLPKALVEVRGRPLLAWVIDRLAQHGGTDIIVNAYYLADQIEAFAARYSDESRFERLKLTVSREDKLLGTGGGIQHASWFFDDGEPFLVHNTDVITDLNLNRLMEAHTKSHALATMAVKMRETKRFLLFDEDHTLCGWQSTDPPETRMTRTTTGSVTALPFMAVHAASPEIFRHMTGTPPFSILDAYLDLASEGHSIGAYRADAARWMDVGRIAHLRQAESNFGAEYFDHLTK
mgnify:CR=1 FL=1